MRARVRRLSRPAIGELQWSGAGKSEVRKNIIKLTFTWYKRQRVETKASSLVQRGGCPTPFSALDEPGPDPVSGLGTGP